MSYLLIEIVPLCKLGVGESKFFISRGLAYKSNFRYNFNIAQKNPEIEKSFLTIATIFLNALPTSICIFENELFALFKNDESHSYIDLFESSH